MFSKFKPFLLNCFLNTSFQSSSSIRMTNTHEKYKTEYSSSYVWHDSAYSNKPERVYVTRGRIRNYSLFSRHKGSLQQLSQPQLQQQQKAFDSVLYFSLHPSPLEEGPRPGKEMEKNENQMKLSNSKKPTARQKQRRSSSTRRYSLEADARGIKSHFVPASLDVLLDLGISSCVASKENGESEKMSVDGEQCVGNQYFTSVYQSDFSCTK